MDMNRINRNSFICTSESYGGNAENQTNLKKAEDNCKLTGKICHRY